MDPNKKSLKVSNIYSCIFCNYNTYKIFDYNKHLTTSKHKILTNPNTNVAKVAKYSCNCGKSYKHPSSLSAHKKNCEMKNNDNSCNNYENNINNVSDKDDLIILLLQQNAQLIQQNSELVKNGINNNKNSKND